MTPAELRAKVAALIGDANTDKLANAGLLPVASEEKMNETDQQRTDLQVVVTWRKQRRYVTAWADVQEV